MRRPSLSSRSSFRFLDFLPELRHFPSPALGASAAGDPGKTFASTSASASLHTFASHGRGLHTSITSASLSWSASSVGLSRTPPSVASTNTSLSSGLISPP